MYLPQRKRVGLPIRQSRRGNENYKGQGCGSYAVVFTIAYDANAKTKNYELTLHLSHSCLVSIPSLLTLYKLLFLCFLHCFCPFFIAF
jgi:hypothetical protein